MAQSFAPTNAAHAVATNAIKESRRKLFVLVQLERDCNYSFNSSMNIFLKNAQAVFFLILMCNVLSKALVCGSPLFPFFVGAKGITRSHTKKP